MNNAILHDRWLKGEKRQTKLNEPSQEAKDLPFYNMLPKDTEGLLKWRIYVRERALVDLEFREAIWQMCAMDVAFFANTFMYIFEPRGDAQALPLMLWGDQVDVLAWWSKYFGKRDMIVPKSRGIGISWMIITLFLWRWLFYARVDLALVSKDNDSLDQVNRPATLMGKLDFAFEHLPAWLKMTPDGKSILKRNSGHHSFENLSNAASIVGYASTDDKLRSGRFTAIGFDELAFYDADVQRVLIASQYTSHCRIFISTYNGTNWFYRLVHDPKTMLVIETFWFANAARWAGAYTSKHGQIIKLDKNFVYPMDYDFIADGLTRSIWFDQELSRAGSNLASALEELNGIAAQNSRRMMPESIEEEAVRLLQPPPFRGFLENGHFVDDFEGPLSFWVPPDTSLRLVYIGVDPAVGVADGAYAAATGIDVDTGLQVFKLQYRNMNAIDFAQKVVEVARFINGIAIINWEVTGIGTTFTTELQRLQYNFLYSPPNTKTGALNSERQGWHNKDKGEGILFEVIRAIKMGELIVRDEETLTELTRFEYDRDQELLFMGIDSHGDRAMALAIAWEAAKLRRRGILLNRKEAKDIIQKHGVENEPRFQLEQESQHNSPYSSRYRHN